MQTGVVIRDRHWREVYDPRIFIPLMAATVFCFAYILTQAQNTVPIRTTTANQQTKTSSAAVSGTPQISIASPSSLPTISTNVSSSTDLSAANTFSPQPSGTSSSPKLDDSGGKVNESSNQNSGMSDFQNFVFNIMNQAGNSVKQATKSIH